MKPSHRTRSVWILLALLVTASAPTPAKKPAAHKAEQTQQKEKKKCNRPPVKKVNNALTRGMRDVGRWIERRWHGEPQPTPTQQPDRRKQVTT